MRKATIITLLASLLAVTGLRAEDYETLSSEPIHNPMIWADCPDPDVIRVGDTY